MRKRGFRWGFGQFGRNFSSFRLIDHRKLHIRQKCLDLWFSIFAPIIFDPLKCKLSVFWVWKPGEETILLGFKVLGLKDQGQLLGWSETSGMWWASFCFSGSGLLYFSLCWSSLAQAQQERERKSPDHLLWNQQIILQLSPWSFEKFHDGSKILNFLFRSLI